MRTDEAHLPFKDDKDQEKLNSREAPEISVKSFQECRMAFILRKGFLI